ncbi:hypothetical protein M409DRAFT_20534 [Zasmidium cellare ATCC 36951]|uniref:F-box domain-containing protein n=1 Tax=Zasmidium cellare ATCC 36951 TaxID=1080233 RepID=A0A6A6CSZ4_ZASCE|nr:uncharacterized protein M409DRAFT_20534 [Zasmidium cellare ATCC 36951]KAF2169308.1 hypothetical protein M409DRAFT_20534 [Zasmidium cellare ATCC 36951]
MPRNNHPGAAEMPSTPTTNNIISSAMDAPRDDTAANGHSADANDHHHFRFLDLPAELRNRIYSYATARKSGDLGGFRIPGIAQVSKQIRKELLPILFAENIFLCQVSSDLLTPHYRRHGNPCRDYQRTRGFAGKLDFQGVVSVLLQSADGESALFRNITFQVYEAHVHDTHVHDGVHLTQWHQHQHFYGFFDLHLAVAGKKLDISVEETPLHPRHRCDENLPLLRRTTLIQVEDIDEAVDRAIQVARGIEGRDGFKGFTLKDLKEVAWGFRFPDE